MTMKQVPNSSITVPSWVDTTALTEKFSPELRQRNLKKIRAIKKHLKAYLQGGER